MTPEEIYKKAIRFYGHQSQMIQTCEECGELIMEISHFMRKKTTIYNLAGEVADVEIMCAQMRLLVGSEAVDRAKAAKLDRLQARLEREGIK